MGYIAALDGILVALFLVANVGLYKNRKKPAILFTMAWNAGMAFVLLVVIMSVCFLKFGYKA